MSPRARTAQIIATGRPASCRNRLHKFARRFRKDESGTLIFFGVYVFVILLMFGGIGIDLMRVERDRAELQYTLDRAVLAAADLDQTLDPADVVADYFEKAGLSEYLGSVVVDQGLSFREVSASAAADVKTQFMHMTGRDTLLAPAASTSPSPAPSAHGDDDWDLEEVTPAPAAMSEGNAAKDMWQDF
mgnify:CR=1 FL=1